MQTPRWPVHVPHPLRGVVMGACGLGAVGCLVGLVIGLVVYPPTAWAAAFEMGLPAAAVGAVAGLLAEWLRPRLVGRPHS